MGAHALLSGLHRWKVIRIPVKIHKTHYQRMGTIYLNHVHVLCFGAYYLACSIPGIKTATD